MEAEVCLEAAEGMLMHAPVRQLGLVLAKAVVEVEGKIDRRRLCHMKIAIAAILILL